VVCSGHLAMPSVRPPTERLTERRQTNANLLLTLVIVVTVRCEPYERANEMRRGRESANALTITEHTHTYTRVTCRIRFDSIAPDNTESTTGEKLNSINRHTTNYSAHCQGKPRIPRSQSLSNQRGVYSLTRTHEEFRQPTTTIAVRNTLVYL